MSPFEIQPGQARFTKNLVQSINVEPSMRNDVQGLKDLTNEIYNDELDPGRMKYIR